MTHLSITLDRETILLTQEDTIGLLWGYALDGEEKPVWKVRPNKDAWQLQHVHGGGHHPSQSGCRAHNFWPLHRVHSYDAFSLRPVLNDPMHFDAAYWTCGPSG